MNPKEVVRMYVLLAILMVLVNDNRKLVLYAVSDRSISMRTRTLPAWYTSPAMAKIRSRGGLIVQTHITMGMLLGHAIVHYPKLGYGVVLLHEARRYAQNHAEKVRS
jgi:hypothetical protein